MAWSPSENGVVVVIKGNAILPKIVEERRRPHHFRYLHELVIVVVPVEKRLFAKYLQKIVPNGGKKTKSSRKGNAKEVRG